MTETKKVLICGSPKGSKQNRANYAKCKKYIEDLTAFGWMPTQETTEKEDNGTYRYQIMARETFMPNYNPCRKMELIYEDANFELRTYKRMDFFVFFFLFVLFVIPGVSYVILKQWQKKIIEENNNKCYERMRKAMSDARNLQQNGDSI